MKIKTFLATGFAIAGIGLFMHTPQADAYTINNEFNLAPNEGDSRIAQPNLIILHETANPRATGRNEAEYMKRSWNNAYTTDIVGDGGIVYRVGEPGYVSYGAGNANPYAPVQIELQHTYDKPTFAKNYEAYINYARDMAKKYNIPLTLDTGTSVWDKGIKSHNWVSQYVWGDHTDPYGYLAEMGVSKAKLASDLANGVGTTANNKPVVNPTKPINHDLAVTESPAKKQGNAIGKLDYFNGFGKNQIRVAGWLVSDTPYGNIGQYAYVLFMEHGTNKELTRVQSQGIKRPDVKKAYGYQGGDALGFDVTVNTKQFKGKKVDVILRRANASNGEKAVNDVRINDIYLSF